MTISIVDWKDPEYEGGYVRLNLEHLEIDKDAIGLTVATNCGGDYEAADLTLTVADAEKLVVELQKWLLKRSAARQGDGFLATLTPDQREQALAYKGPENFGSAPVKARQIAPVEVYRILRRHYDEAPITSDDLSKLSRDIAALSTAEAI